MNGTTLDIHGTVTAFDPAKNKGLRKLRNSTEKKPTFHCDRCKKDRYTPCGCGAK